jgi:hypothetical protein
MPARLFTITFAAALLRGGETETLHMPFAHIGELDFYFERSGSGAPLLFISGSGADLRLVYSALECSS